MATNTYVALATQTLGTAASSVTFSSIPQGYTDLVMVVSASQTGGSVNQGKLAVGNGSIDTGSNYSETILYGNGSSALSARTNGTWWNADYLAAPPLSGIPNACIYHFQNYSNTTTYKTVLSRSNVAGNGLEAMVHLWRSTAAINTILYGVTGGSLAAGTTISIYGIAAADVGAKATGGTIYSDATYWYHLFTSNGTFTPTQSITADYFLVGGGGGGGSFQSGVRWGYGGAGGYVSTLTSKAMTATAYAITVGAGGANGTGSGGANGASGTASSLIGGALSDSASGGVGGNGSTYQQYGAGNVNAGVNNYGGIGIVSTFSGSSVKYAGGGSYGNPGSAPSDDGSNYGGGLTKEPGPVVSPIANTGGGGGGGQNQGDGGARVYSGQTGASGLVIVRYPKA